MARSRKRTEKEMFDAIKLLRKSGLCAQKISELYNVGENRIYCIDDFETYEEFKEGRTKKYESWRKTPRTSHSKKTEEEKASAEEMTAEPAPVDETEASVAIIKLLKQINEQLALIVGELT